MRAAALLVIFACATGLAAQEAPPDPCPSWLSRPGEGWNTFEGDVGEVLTAGSLLIENVDGGSTTYEDGRVVRHFARTVIANLAGIDPRLSDESAIAFLRALRGKRVQFVSTDRPEGNEIGTVFGALASGEMNYNRELLRRGLAHFLQPPGNAAAANDPCFLGEAPPAGAP